MVLSSRIDFAAIDVAEMIASIGFWPPWRTRSTSSSALCPCAPDGMIGSMITVPLPAAAGTTMEDAERLRTTLLVEDRIEVQMHAWRAQLWVRVLAQIYNDQSDS